MNYIQSVTLTLENCETFTLPINVFGTFYIGHIYTSIRRTAMNMIAKFDRANEVVMEIFFPEAEERATKEFFFSGDYPTILERLKAHRDITSITLTDKDGTRTTYEVDYKDEVEGQLGANNLNQKTYLSACGNLYIVIGENRHISDYFNEDIINNNGIMKIKKDWYI